MATQTRARFIEHQLGFRPGAPRLLRTQVIREWNAKTQAQRVAWLAALTNIERCTARVDQQEPGAWNLYHAVINTSANALAQLRWTEHYEIFRKAAIRARKSNHVLAERCEALNQAWLALHAEESQHEGIHEDSRDRDNDMAGQARGRRNAARNNEIEMQRWIDRPPARGDPTNDNVERILAQLVPPERRRHCRLRRLDFDVEHGVPGLVPGSQLPGPAGQWRPWTTFRGGGGKTRLWLKFDADDNLVDRLFRKDVFWNQHRWKDPTCWDGDVRKPAERWPVEIACHKRLGNCTTPPTPGMVPARSVANIRGTPDRFHIDNDFESYKIYTVWAMHGDLNNLISRCRGQAYVPEAFIWCVAENLADAAVAMASVSANEEIVHRDLKPQNVFLSVPDPQLYPDYAQPLLADFGAAIITSEGERWNPSWYWGVDGTPGYYAPEQRQVVDVRTADTIEDWALGQRTNVFGIGLILYCLAMARHRNHPDDNLWLGDVTTNTIYDFPADVTNQYSPALLELIHRCLRHDPAQRPTAQGLSDEIATNTGINGGNVDHTHGIRLNTATPAVQQDQSIAQMLSPDRYRLGLSRANVPDAPA